MIVFFGLIVTYVALGSLAFGSNPTLGIATLVIIVVWFSLIMVFVWWNYGRIFGGRITTKLTFEKPSGILIACTGSYYGNPQVKFDLDIQAIKSAYSKLPVGRIAVEVDLTKDKLLDVLNKNQFDIVHLTALFDAQTGDLDFQTGDEDNMLEVNSFVAALQGAKVNLVVLATCTSAKAASRISRFAHVVGALESPSGNDFGRWATSFYQRLARGETLIDAFNVSSDIIGNQFVMFLSNRIESTATANPEPESARA
jgi:hypothetical protein